jgi:putative ABC transport system permease protein
MSIMENIRLAISSLLANKMRALLTMLGIIIGIGSVIGIMTVGDSLSGSISSSIQSLGAKNIAITLQPRESNQDSVMTSLRGLAKGAADKDMISNDMLRNLRAAFPQDIEAISIIENVGNGQSKDGSRYANLNLSGVNSDYAKANDLSIVQGHFLTPEETQSFKKIAVVSDRLTDNMFGRSEALGRTIDVVVDGVSEKYTIVGIYKYTPSALTPVMTSEKDLTTTVFIPINTALHRTGSVGYQNVTIMTSPTTDSVAFASNLEAFFNYYYANNQDYTVRAYSMESMADTVNSVMGTLTIAISLIAAISLLVGGIGVMNIMLVSITERTREIGTRKALGATNGSIRIQFIVESVFICMIGGAIGILLGLGLGNIGASFLGYPAVASLDNIALAVGFSTAIGVFFGYYPANKAAKLDPIEALRYE